MKNQGNTALLISISCVLIFLLYWVISIQTQAKNTKLYVEQTFSAQVNHLQHSIKRGKILFEKEPCNSCHKIRQRICFGVQLKNIRERRSKEFLVAFIRNEDSLVKIKHPEAIALKEEYKWSNGLHNRKHLSINDIEDMLNFIDFYE